VGYKFWLKLNKEQVQGIGKNIKALRYGPFEALEKVGDNSYGLNLPPYMNTYSVVNVKNKKLNEPYIFERDKVLPTIEDLELESQVKLE
jgi:hypothetical protein